MLVLPNIYCAFPRNVYHSVDPESALRILIGFDKDDAISFQRKLQSKGLQADSAMALNVLQQVFRVSKKNGKRARAAQ